jgi:hypothetical protein
MCFEKKMPSFYTICKDCSLYVEKTIFCDGKTLREQSAALLQKTAKLFILDRDKTVGPIQQITCKNGAM